MDNIVSDEDWMRYELQERLDRACADQDFAVLFELIDHLDKFSVETLDG